MIVSVNFHFWKYDITEFHIRKGPGTFQMWLLWAKKWQNGQKIGYCDKATLIIIGEGYSILRFFFLVLFLLFS